MIFGRSNWTSGFDRCDGGLGYRRKTPILRPSSLPAGCLFLFFATPCRRISYPFLFLINLSPRLPLLCLDLLLERVSFRPVEGLANMGIAAKTSVAAVRRRRNNHCSLALRLRALTGATDWNWDGHLGEWHRVSEISGLGLFAGLGLGGNRGWDWI